MCFKMCFHISFFRKSLTAARVGTNMRLLPSMGHNVRLQRTFPTKTVITNLALIRSDI